MHGCRARVGALHTYAFLRWHEPVVGVQFEHGEQSRRHAHLTNVHARGLHRQPDALEVSANSIMRQSIVDVVELGHNVLENQLAQGNA